MRWFFFFSLACGLGATSAAHAQAPGVRATVESRMREVRACYEVALSQTGSSAGTLAMVWTIDDSGTARDVRVDPKAGGKNAAPRDSDLAACIAAKLRTWHFPPSLKGHVRPASYAFSSSK